MGITTTVGLNRESYSGLAGHHEYSRFGWNREAMFFLFAYIYVHVFSMRMHSYVFVFLHGRNFAVLSILRMCISLTRAVDDRFG